MSVIMNLDFTQFLDPMLIIALFLGSFVGMLIGAMPGLGASIAIIMILPLSYTMTPLAAILMLLSAYQAAEYGGSISSIMLGIPGTPAAVATVLDGSYLAKQGSPGKALAYSLTASSIGGLVGGLALMFLSIPLAALSRKLSDPEIFLIAVMGLVAAASVGSKNFFKSMVSVGIGLLLSSMGTDLFTGAVRFTFGTNALADGIKMMSVLVGLYAITELLGLVSSKLHTVYMTSKDAKGLKTSLTLKEFKGVLKPIALGSLFGAGLGGIPGLGPAVAAFLAYGTITKIGDKKIPFGQGNPQGIAAPEAANNSGVGSNIIPALVLGIPSTATIAIVMSAFIVHGIKPGPKIFISEPQLVGGLLVGFLFTTVVMYIIGRLLTPLFAKSLLISNAILVPIILSLSILGVYASEVSFLAVVIAIGIGTIGFFIVKLDFSMTAIVMAFVLGPLIEDSYRRALLTSRGSNMIFLQRPISLALIIIIIAAAITIVAVKVRKKKKLQAVSTDIEFVEPVDETQAEDENS